ncbi:PREDICTED: janus kinase and microtubule-interacting protein 3-like [Priapulus caudatus]|uniref:Janus kinase and microtubule-interacting protein 3-like n=1 Tax=Priapulus caudatus TaxID=37621 RepID=A0ABM1EAA9_PRICU|nr:PREDICTED: janus kinase and microtubule-interacting protein 3-like [Priapulus caudatus]
MSSTRRPDTGCLPADDSLRVANDSLREEILDLRSRLEAEQEKCRQLLRERAQGEREARVTERRISAEALRSSTARLCEEKQSELLRQKELLTQCYRAEMEKVIRSKDERFSKTKSELTRQNEELAAHLQVALQQQQAAQGRESTMKYEADIGRLKNEVAELRSNKRHLEEQLQTIIEADRQKATDIRAMHEQHQIELGRMRKDGKQEVVRLNWWRKTGGYRTAGGVNNVAITAVDTTSSRTVLLRVFALFDVYIFPELPEVSLCEDPGQCE